MTNREKYFSKVSGKLLVDIIDCDSCYNIVGIGCSDICPFSKCPFLDEKMCDKWLDEECDNVKE